MAERYEWWSNTKCSLHFSVPIRQSWHGRRDRPPTHCPLKWEAGGIWFTMANEIRPPLRRAHARCSGSRDPIRYRHPGLESLGVLGAVVFSQVLKICFCLKCIWHRASKHTVNLDIWPCTVMWHFLRPQQSSQRSNLAERLKTWALEPNCLDLDPAMPLISWWFGQVT